MLRLTESPLFHIPTQAGVAWAAAQLCGKNRYAMTWISGTLIATLALCDFAVGVATDFRHLPISENLAFTNYLVELLKAYLFLNMLYTAQVDPAGFDFIGEGVLPLLGVTAVETAQNTQTVHALRPFLIGIVPNVVAAFYQKRELNPHLILWYRIALPLYSVRYLFASPQVWQLMGGWICYNLAILASHMLCN